MENCSRTVVHTLHASSRMPVAGSYLIFLETSRVLFGDARCRLSLMRPLFNEMA
jgi:hypothetical protein